MFWVRKKYCKNHQKNIFDKLEQLKASKSNKLLSLMSLLLWNPVLLSLYLLVMQCRVVFSSDRLAARKSQNHRRQMKFIIFIFAAISRLYGTRARKNTWFNLLSSGFFFMFCIIFHASRHKVFFHLLIFIWYFLI